MANTVTMSKIVVILICFGSNLGHEQNDKDRVHGSRTHNESNITCNFPAQYMTQSTTLTKYCLCTCCHETNTPRSQCIIFKESNTTWAMLLFEKHYITDSQFLHPRNTFAKM